MTITMKINPRLGLIPGRCANCGKAMYIGWALLDDCYAVWVGRCPHCEALNLPDLTKGVRGYSSQGIDLTLPTPGEAEVNNWPNCPTRN